MGHIFLLRARLFSNLLQPIGSSFHSRLFPRSSLDAEPHHSCWLKLKCFPALYERCIFSPLVVLFLASWNLTPVCNAAFMPKSKQTLAFIVCSLHSSLFSRILPHKFQLLRLPELRFSTQLSKTIMLCLGSSSLGRFCCRQNVSTNQKPESS